ncbi:MAG: T9SS type A sorting domain-containing protein, partial [Bacteroidota bacterium]
DAGDSANQWIVVFDPEGPGTFTVQMLDSLALDSVGNPSVGSAVLTLVVQEPPVTGLEIPLLTGWKVYPNPAQHTVQVALPESLAHSPYRVQLINAQGKVCLEHSGNGVSGQLDVSSLTSGMYLLQVITPEAQGSTTLVIE